MNLALTVISSRLGLIPNTSRCGWDRWGGGRVVLLSADRALWSPASALLSLTVSMSANVLCCDSSKHVFVPLLITALSELLLAGAGLRNPGAELRQAGCVDSLNELR